MDQPVNVVRCKSCGEYIEIPPQEPKTIIKTEPCRCGMTQGTREGRYLATTVCTIGTLIILSLFGGCWMSHYYTTEQVKALPQNYEIQKLAPGQGMLFGPEYEVKKKGEAPEPTIKIKP